MNKLIACAIFSTLTLGGCAAMNKSLVDFHMDEVARTNPPPLYMAGQRDGCKSGYSAAGFIYENFAKDVVLFDGNSLYKQGWTDGYGACKSSYRRL